MEEVFHAAKTAFEKKYGNASLDSELVADMVQPGVYDVRDPAHPERGAVRIVVAVINAGFVSAAK